MNRSPRTRGGHAGVGRGVRTRGSGNGLRLVDIDTLLEKPRPKRQCRSLYRRGSPEPEPSKTAAPQNSLETISLPLTIPVADVAIDPATSEIYYYPSPCELDTPQMVIEVDLENQSYCYTSSATGETEPPVLVELIYEEESSSYLQSPPPSPESNIIVITLDNSDSQLTPSTPESNVRATTPDDSYSHLPPFPPDKNVRATTPENSNSHTPPFTPEKNVRAIPPKNSNSQRPPPTPDKKVRAKTLKKSKSQPSPTTPKKNAKATTPKSSDLQPPSPSPKSKAKAITTKRSDSQPPSPSPKSKAKATTTKRSVAKDAVFAAPSPKKRKSNTQRRPRKRSPSTCDYGSETDDDKSDREDLILTGPVVNRRMYAFLDTPLDIEVPSSTPPSLGAAVPSSKTPPQAPSSPSLLQQLESSSPLLPPISPTSAKTRPPQQTQTTLPLRSSSSSELPTSLPSQEIPAAQNGRGQCQQDEGSSWMSDPFYKFKWRTFPDPPIPPEWRREKFSNIHCGPTNQSIDPLEIFLTIWDRDIMEKITSETNKYANQLLEEILRCNVLHPSSEICNWRPTTPDELYVYFAIVLAMGVVIKSKLDEYWGSSNDIFMTPGFGQYMSLNRFQWLSTCIHFNDNKNMGVKSLSASEAKLFKIEPIISHLNCKFQNMYNMQQNITIDKSLLEWKGGVKMNQFISNKVASAGVKSHEVCESQTGYLWRFRIHAHNEGSKYSSTQDPLTAHPSSLVLQLLKGLGHKGHTIWMDNFYNSPILARKLKSLGFDCAGTLRTNRLYVPRELDRSNMAEGQVAGCTSGDVDIMVWRDLNRVSMISTYHGNYTSADNYGKTAPILIRDYNLMMAGIDKKDQLLSEYPIERKRTKVWYKKLFRRLLNVSVLNAYIIHRHPKQQNPNPLSHRMFRITLVNALLKHASKTNPNKSLSDNGLRNNISSPKVFDAEEHYPCYYPISVNSRKKRLCVVCKTASTTYCAGCNESACIRCFKNLHAKKRVTN